MPEVAVERVRKDGKRVRYTVLKEGKFVQPQVQRQLDASADTLDESYVFANWPKRAQQS